MRGHFLVSEMELEDPNFYRTVVLIVNHDDDGAFGLVVNRCLDIELEKALPEFGGEPAGKIPLYLGGPVEPRYLFVLHSGLPGGLRSEHASEPVPGVVFEPSFAEVSAYLREEWPGTAPDDKPRINLFAGYSGWGPGQLEGELAEKAWLVLPATPDIVFHPQPEKGWADAMARKGPFYELVAEMGFKPSIN